MYRWVFHIESGWMGGHMDICIYWWMDGLEVVENNKGGLYC